MSRVEHRSNPRVEVTVRAMTSGPIRMANPNWEAETLVDGPFIARQIERTVPGVEAALRFDTAWICSHCALDWETDSATGEPQCCNAAQVEWKAAS